MMEPTHQDLLIGAGSDAFTVICLCEVREEKADLICQVLIKEMNESEPTDETSRRQYVMSKPIKVEFSGIRIAETYLLAIWQPSG